MGSMREVVEGVQVQGEDEEIAYTLDISDVGTNPTHITVVAKNTATDQDVSATVLEGDPSLVSPTLIKLPVLKSLTRAQEYRIEIKFTVMGQVLEHYFIVECEE
jgi:hypothetical protein